MKSSTMILLLAGALAVPTAAQTVDRVTPNTASPGDFVYLEGSALSGALTVEFTADLGGSAGVTTVSQSPLFVSHNRVIAYAPLMRPEFAAPDAAPPGNPTGSVRLTTTTGDSNERPFFYQQGTFIQTPTGYERPQISTLGLGTSALLTNKRPVVSFDLTSGPPVTGSRFVMELEHAPAFRAAVLIIGFPMSPPYIPIEDGWLVLDLSLPVIVVPGFTTDLSGDAQIPIRLPAGYFGAALANQWVILDTGQPGGLAVSNALRYRI